MLDRSDVRKRWTYFDIADIISKNLDECIKKTQQANQLNEPSLNSSYADLFEASGVVIHDYEGSLSHDHISTNQVTYNLSKCKSHVVVPYYRLLCLIGWRPFPKSNCRLRGLLSIVNFVYIPIFIGILLFWYAMRVITCQGRLTIDTDISPTMPLPTSAPPTTPPLNVSALPWVETKNATLLRTKIKPDLLEPSARCNHVFGTYIVPGIMHFIAYIIGIYHFRIQDHEGLYVLMEKVYLQSAIPMRITKHLRAYLFAGFFWWVYATGTCVLYLFVFKVDEATTIDHQTLTQSLMIAVDVAVVLSGMFARCVHLAVVLSYCGQCQLLKYYIEGLAEKLEEKSIELKSAMKRYITEHWYYRFWSGFVYILMLYITAINKAIGFFTSEANWVCIEEDILEIKRHFNRLNGVLSLSMSCIVFDMMVVTAITTILLFNFNIPLQIWLYRLTVLVEWGSILVFVLAQAALLTSSSAKLREKVLTVRVFGYQSYSQLDIDSFLNFVNMIKLEAQIFTIPVKPRYLWALLIFSVQILILMFQTGKLGTENKWL